MKRILALSDKILKCCILLSFLFVVRPVSAQQQILTLQQSRQLALGQNKQISIQTDSISIAKLGFEKAKTNLLPSIDGMAMGTYVGKSLSDYLPARSGSVSGTATEVIYSGGKIRNSIKVAKVNQDAQQITMEKNKAEVILKTDSAYWQVVAAKQQLSSLKKSKEYLSATVKDINNAFKAGTKFKNDLLQVQIQYNQNELQLFKAENGLTLAKMNLVQVIGLNKSVNFDVTDTIPFAPIAIPLDSTYDNNVDKRPETRLLLKSIEAGELKTKIAYADLLPQVSVAAYGFYSTSSSPGFVNLIGISGGAASSNAVGSSFTGWLGLLSIKFPLFHWGYYRKGVKQYQLRTDASRDQLIDARQKITLEIRKSYYSLMEAEKNVNLSELSLTQANENLRLANDRLKAGTISTTDWLLAQNTWQQTFTQSVTAKVDYNIYTTKFKKAVGELE